MMSTQTYTMTMLVEEDMSRANQSAGPLSRSKPLAVAMSGIECRRLLEGDRRPGRADPDRLQPPLRPVLRRGRAIRAGEIGDLRQVIITSRDPEIPPVAYMKVAGGLLRDMTIHDFDLARFLLGEEPVEVAAFANALIAQEVRDLGENDTAMILLRTANGRQCCITNYRKATYGYDQRIEVVGELGMLKAENRRATSVERWDGKRTEAKDPILHFFIERYREAYVLELDDFIEALEQGRPCDPGFEAGRRALLLANAAYESIASGRIVRLQG